MPEHTCPTCGKKMDRASSAFGDHAPKVGDLTVCINCGNVSQFDEKFQLMIVDVSKLPLETRAEIAAVKRALSAVKGLST